MGRESVGADEYHDPVTGLLVPLRVLILRDVLGFHANDIDALVALLTDDVFMSMPPLPLDQTEVTNERPL
jgi:hypothetical protein